MDVRRCVALVGLLVLLASAGCNSSENSQLATGLETSEPPSQSDTIAILFHRGDAAFDNAIRDGLAAAAREYGVAVEFMEVLDRDGAEQQLELLNKAVEERCRGICIYPLDPASIVAPLTTAQQLGIPLVTFGRPVAAEVTVVSHASTDHFHAGRAMAEFCAENLADDAKVLLVDCRSNDESAARRNGFSYAAQKELERFEMIDVACEEDIVASIRGSLDEHDDAAAVVAFNVRSSQAALEALAEHNQQQKSSSADTEFGRERKQRSRMRHLPPRCSKTLT